MAKKDETVLLIKAIKSNTEKWSKKYFEDKSKQSEKAKKLSKLLGEFVDLKKTDKATMAKVLSEISGEDVIVEADEDVEFRPITALVLTKLNTTDAKHNYETEKVLISIGDSTAVTPEGTVGGFIPKKRSIMRPATAAEIDSIPKSQLEKMMEEVNIIMPE